MPMPMSISRTLALFGACLAACHFLGRAAAPKTVCTITVNSRTSVKASAATFLRGLSLRRTGGARPARLACFRVRAARAVRRPDHLRPLRRRHRVLHRPPGPERVPVGRGDGAGLLQRVLPGRVLAPEGGLPLRLQHAEARGAADGDRRHRARTAALRPLARRRRQGGGGAGRTARRQQPRPHAAHPRTCLSSTASRRSRRSGARRGRCSIATSSPPPRPRSAAAR